MNKRQALEGLRSGTITQDRYDRIMDMLEAEDKRIPEGQRAYVYHVIYLIEAIIRQSPNADDRITAHLNNAVNELRNALLTDLV